MLNRIGEDGKVAVIGAGAAGIGAAFALSARRRVVLFEKEDRPGGHVLTREIRDGTGEKGALSVDMGFIVSNPRNYPNLYKFFQAISVATAQSEMSFGFEDQESGLAYAGTGFSGLFAQRENLLRPSHWRFLLEILRFGRVAKAGLSMNGGPAGKGGLDGQTLGGFLDANGFSAALARNYALPMASAIWSASGEDARRFPMRSFASFFDNHGLLTFLNRPVWRYLPGGSSTYVRAFLEVFAKRGGELRLGVSPRVRRTMNGVEVRQGGHVELFDAVVVATHADQALDLLDDPTPLESELLGSWRYSKNRVILHPDGRFLPAEPRAGAAWNFRRFAGHAQSDKATLTYDMNRLQRLADMGARRTWLVSLNPPDEPHEIQHEAVLEHPVYDMAALASQLCLPELNRLAHGSKTAFCGAYHGHGFHEDAFASGLRAAMSLGAPDPWEPG